MPFTNFPYGVTSFGAPMVPAIFGKPGGFNGPGTGSAPGSNVYFVNSATKLAADAAGSNGRDPSRPFKTINYAVAQCTANNGDVIYVGPQHVETVSAAAGLTIGVAGVTIIGVGNDISDRPTVNYKTSTLATVTITAASTWIQGINFHNSIDARVDGLIISANDCRIIDCDFYDDTGTSSLISIRTTAAANRLRLFDVRCYFSENTGTQRTEFVRIVGGNDHEIIFCYTDVVASFSTATFNNPTTAFAGMLMADCYWTNNNAGAPAAAFLATSSGLMIDRTDFLSTGISAVTLPTGVGAFSIDGDSVLTTPAHQGTPVQGSTIAFQKSFTSSALTTVAQTFITCTGGSIVVEGITVETDATGLAGGTNHQLLTNNANGLALLAAETVANLGANKTVDLTAASVTALRKGFVLESGKVLQLDNTVGAGTGAGKIFYTLYGRVLSGAPILS